MWRPSQADDWSQPEDGETTEEMAEALMTEHQEEHREALMNERLFQLSVAGLFTRDGRYLGKR